eukprot:CAMPEP_0118710528 /NCGR_PEP_ID=MMETSP0800-20121206/23441_1 /TAXON_ID=210618 ORGANISM="Striatella unipunctata, Strain CCMP2910" /NCGR_SAMPLE_ID=MMETSP0800 /ASSEMBLY_ACC=CAM_ASM_000638 /LENGTH=93 /DNA_ID=CAMNT_0006614739 /DNA_START=77 /DNA_END=357 /DNA_ORIENTATION=-
MANASLASVFGTNPNQSLQDLEALFQETHEVRRVPAAAVQANLIGQFCFCVVHGGQDLVAIQIPQIQVAPNHRRYVRELIVADATLSFFFGCV